MFHSLHVHQAVAPYTCVGCHSRFWQFPRRSINHCETLFVSIFFILLIIQLLLFLLIFTVWICDVAYAMWWVFMGYWHAANRQKSAWSGQHLQCFEVSLAGTNKPIQVIPGQRQEYSIDSSVTRLYKIDLRRKIKMLQTFIRLLVSELWVRWLEIVFMQPIFMLDGPRLCLPWQIVTLLTDVNGVSIRTGVFFAGYMSCFQMSPHWLWTSLIGMVVSGNNKMMQFYDRFGGDSFMVWVMFCFFRITMPVLTVYESSMFNSSSTSIEYYSQQWTQTFPPLNMCGTWQGDVCAKSKIAKPGQVLQELNRLPQLAIGRTICSMLHRLNECQTNITHHW